MFPHAASPTIFAVMESRVANLESDTTLKKDNISQAAVIASLQFHNQQQDSLIFSIFDSTHSPILLAILFKHGYKMLVQAPHTSPTPIRAAYVPQSINTQADLARERNLVQMEILARRKQFGSAKHLAHEISDKILKLSHHFKVVGQPWEGPMVWYAAQVSSFLQI
ncbi:hypothetical protein BDD12DRAFT_855288 [Trichophaea hybrida]|nr:hypothetical protein BDD12DRAFT_855288 [Trichophaea hybrida]